MIELPIFIPCGELSLFGVLTTPDAGSEGLVVVAGGGGFNAATFQRNGVATRLARRLAGAGLAVLRFDYHGIGDSTGEIREFDLEEPLQEDIVAAVTWGRAAGFDRIGIVGICFGSRTALSIVDVDESVSALVLVTMPFADATATTARRLRKSGVVRALLKPATWRRLTEAEHRRNYRKRLRSWWRQRSRRSGRAPDVGATAKSRLKTAGSRSIPVLMLYGSEDNHYRNARESLQRIQTTLPSIEIDASYPGAFHGFPTLVGQEAFVEKLAGWLPGRLGITARAGEAVFVVEG